MNNSIDENYNEKIFFTLFIISLFFVVGLISIVYVWNYFSEREWNNLKNDCELSAVLDNDNYQYVCQIDLTFKTVIIDKLDNQHWENFKNKNHCYIETYDLTEIKNKKQWLCDNNVTFYYDN